MLVRKNLNYDTFRTINFANEIIFDRKQETAFLLRVETTSKPDIFLLFSCDYRTS